MRPVSSVVNIPDVKGEINFLSVVGSGSFFVSVVATVVVVFSFSVSSPLLVSVFVSSPGLLASGEIATKVSPVFGS
jgi:hypothetical protein